MLARLNNKCLEHCGLTKFHTGSTLLMSKKKNHYDVLGLSSKATKSQIKKSYYELSLKFHPDQNKGDEKAANKFREITEAYEILGNATKKRLYDQGLYGMGSSSSASDPPLSRHKEYVKHVKHKVPATGRTEAYNFDAWTKAHYSETFQRKQRETFDRKEREKVMEEIRERNKKYHNEENDRLVLFMGLVTLFVGILYATASIETKSKDKPR